jgi:Suppressor of fused protein (SUFU)
MDLEEVWRIREEEIYPALFGSKRRGIFALDASLFKKKFRQSSVDPTWTQHGVFEFAPTAGRNSWLYVTSGLSNPWEVSPKDYETSVESGAGVELTFATSEPGDWAITALQSLLAYDILQYAGRFPKIQPLGLDHRVPCGGPLNGKRDCVIRYLVMTEPEGIPDSFVLPSGKVLFGGVTGLSEAEFAEAKATSSQQIVDRLRAAGFHPVNDPKRPSL